MHSDFLNIQTKMRSEKFSNNRTLNLKALGNGRGVRHLTIRNTGKATLRIGDEAQELLVEGSTFTINSMFLVTNESLELTFVDADGVQKEAIMRYLVDVCE